MNGQGLSGLQLLLNVWPDGVKKVNIIKIEFEKEMKLTVNQQEITLICFKADEHGNIKFGVNAPKNVGVNREEIHFMKMGSNCNGPQSTPLGLQTAHKTGPD